MAEPTLEAIRARVANATGVLWQLHAPRDLAWLLERVESLEARAARPSAKQARLLESLLEDPGRESVRRLICDLGSFAERSGSPTQYTLNKLWWLMGDEMADVTPREHALAAEIDAKLLAIESKFLGAERHGEANRKLLAEALAAYRTEVLAARRQHGRPGHFDCAERCRFRLHTSVNGYRVSTIGEWYVNECDVAPSSVGTRLYETMVFQLGEYDEPVSWTEIESRAYNLEEDAEVGHAEMVEKYAAARGNGG